MNNLYENVFQAKQNMSSEEINDGAQYIHEFFINYKKYSSILHLGNTVKTHIHTFSTTQLVRRSNFEIYLPTISWQIYLFLEWKQRE